MTAGIFGVHAEYANIPGIRDTNNAPSGDLIWGAAWAARDAINLHNAATVKGRIVWVATE